MFCLPERLPPPPPPSRRVWMRCADFHFAPVGQCGIEIFIQLNFFLAFCAHLPLVAKKSIFKVQNFTVPLVPVSTLALSFIN